MAKKQKINQDDWFEPDKAPDTVSKNTLLANYLNGIWSKLSIVEIKRIEIGDTGWQVIYRKKSTALKKKKKKN